ncbi:MAG: HD domain-containing protein [Eubacteriales bacterium]|jgi:uncharacterized protein|nr:HD domain-containing protein [Eubacteriales bacterium]MDD3863181.1 HD domain-containing protein [Eubacteriales bacterium]MDD4445468.1 HD domain-containing protein [Eubacteriales bacterium]
MRSKFLSKVNNVLRGANYAEVMPQFQAVYSVVLGGENLGKMMACKQHKNCNCLEHSIAVAYFSLLIANRFKIKCSRSSLLRGALLHDYHLGDWRGDNGSSFRHGFSHAKAALKNANAEFALDLVEQDAILHHMFPMNPIPPKYKEGVIVCIVDKVCAVYEATSARPYKKLLAHIRQIAPIR